MKKTVLVLALIFCFFLPFSVSAKEMPITEENLPLLKGKWEGTWDLTMGGRGRGPMGLLIENESCPLKGSLIFYKLDAGGSRTEPFENGVLEKGELFIQWEKYKNLRLKLYVPKGAPELRGELFWEGKSGTYRGGRIIFYKK